MRWKTTALLLIAAVGLGAYISLYEIRQPSPEERRDTATHLINLSPRSITQVTLELPAATLTLRRTAEGWRVEPPGARADADRVTPLLEAVSPLIFQRALSAVPGHPLDLASYGLKPPVGVITFTASGAAHRSRGIAAAIRSRLATVLAHVLTILVQILPILPSIAAVLSQFLPVLPNLTLVARAPVLPQLLTVAPDLLTIAAEFLAVSAHLPMILSHLASVFTQSLATLRPASRPAHRPGRIAVGSTITEGVSTVLSKILPVASEIPLIAPEILLILSPLLEVLSHALPVA